jgi:preprotein translocase subunit SecE
MAERPNPFTFLQQVRAEAAKVVWPSRRETAISTAMVIVMAFVAAIFFLTADQLISYGVKFLLGLGSGT